MAWLQLTSTAALLYGAGSPVLKTGRALAIPDFDIQG
jgi:hypothetical protein